MQCTIQHNITHRIRQEALKVPNTLFVEYVRTAQDHISPAVVITSCRVCSRCGYT